ncbi:AraC family transcriptional regulator [Christiangramia sp. SM2212]|uniref:AraC family transcriptional regulator n=1 Tax=Christiangramia sediminicola TaxID=3073267 RepID=A0ABU1ESH5_9FLAO|nr:AraC family transcriptional regulator [Christiangramia sp. SM2212]MDR5591118.1 AraC family transcriptional regulator [Christiangramia sp. SM2212]
MRKLENFISVKPHFKLQKYVDSYYFHMNTDPKNKSKFTYYPNIKHAVTIYQDSIGKTDNNKTIVRPKNGVFSAHYSTVKTEPHQVEIQGEFRKIGIIFQPYGLNHFIQRNIKDFHFQTISNFCEWDSSFQELSKKIWRMKNIDSRVTLLDSFLIEKKTQNPNEEFQEMIDWIIYSEDIYSLQDIAQKYNLNRKKIYRLFLKELNCTPTVFFKILRFRRSLDNYLKNQSSNLTEASIAQFYDQSNFIKTVKQITSVTPKKLTKELSDLDNSIFWKIY